ncbi:uncharacterized protein VTP21DRAFT_3386 [Calcarisporiella thermophila]|uniref:uncharacterized protein n=1 Tax=Calcarisporiella thermophila TaxID=911321 RepID=UPI0037445335
MTVYRTYPIRFFGLIIIALLNISNSFNWLTFASVAVQSQDYYRIEPTQLNFFSFTFLFVFIVLSWPTAWMLRRFSLKLGLTLAATLNALGAWVRYFGTFAPNPATAFAIAMLGQVISASAQPTLLSVPTQYAATWFSQEGRATATMVGSVANPLGVAVASAVLPEIVKSKGSVPLGLLTAAIIATVFAIPTPFIPNKPPTPPSPSAFYEPEPYLQGVQKLVRNINFWVLFFVFGSFVGAFSAFTSLLSLIVTPYNYTEADAGVFSIILVVCGLVGAISMAIVSDRTKRHSLIIKTMTPSAGVLLIGLIFAVREDDFIGIAVVCALLGFVMFSCLPVGLELGVECTYPIAEATSSAALWMGSQIFSIIFLFAMDALRDSTGVPKNNMRRSLIFVAAIGMVAGLSSLLYRGRNNRIESERNMDSSPSSTRPQGPGWVELEDNRAMSPR